MKKTFMPADILLPRQVSMDKWSVVACDQYSSEPAYWARVSDQVGDAPSTLNMIFPEAYLAGADMAQAARQIAQGMENYLEAGLFDTLHQSFVYVERRLHSGRVRRGLMGVLDLECYDYSLGTTAPIRASENTVIDRLPPRIQLRENAPLEMPHVMVLIDDEERSVIEPLGDCKDSMVKCYDFDLMENGGHIAGYQVTGERAAGLMKALDRLADPQVFADKYGVDTDSVTQMIIGDGNHSLAAAKACWDKVKTEMSDRERENHPARYALVELTNVHDTSLLIEPIHRVAFDTSVNLAEGFVQACPNARMGQGEGYHIHYLYGQETGTITVSGLTIGQTIGALQQFLDDYVRQNGGEIDYIHGDDSLRQLAQQPGSTGFFMPPVEKSDLFKSVIAGGVFPKKSFSMGHAEDKRFYLECRKIK